MDTDNEDNSNETTRDCLMDACMNFYENSLWFMKFFFKTLWQVLIFTKEELHYTQYEQCINTMDILSLNNSARENYSKKFHRKLTRSNSQYSRKKTLSSKVNLFSNKTRVTVRSISNQNLNRADSDNSLIIKENIPSSTLGTINSHITVVPVKSSFCQNKNLQNDFKQSENINLREQIADLMCHPSRAPFMYMHRGMCCGHCRPLCFPNIPIHYSKSNQHLPLTILQQLDSKQDIDLSQRSANASESQLIEDSGSPNIQTPLTDTMPQNEPLSIDTLSNNEISPSQQSDNQLKLNAETLVDDSIQNARAKYQKILQMNKDQNLVPSTDVDFKTTMKKLSKTRSKSVSISAESNREINKEENTLCRQLCNKLNLSDPNQINEIIRILASTAPHILKEHTPTQMHNTNGDKDYESTLCNQLLLHPPFKPKRLIHLCPDGSIQVLSAVDDNSNENNNQIINEQQYQLNYSNSAILPKIPLNPIVTNESSLALMDIGETNVNGVLITESTSTQQSLSKNEIVLDRFMIDNHSILSLQQKKTLFTCNNQTTTISQQNNPIVEIKLDLNDDETIEENDDVDQNSLPEIFFKRISTDNDRKFVSNKVHYRSHRHRSRTSTKKKSSNTDQ